jgi:hypothetical protein
VCQPPAEAGTFTITGTISFHEVYSDGLDGVLTTDATVDVRIRGSETECCQDVESIDGSRIRYVAERSGVCTWRAEREGVLVPADEGAGTGEVGGTLSASPYGDELVLSIQVYGASYVESCPTGTYDGHSPIFYVSCGWATSLVGRSNGQNPASYDFSCAQTGTLGDGSGPGFSHQVSGTLTTSR